MDSLTTFNNFLSDTELDCDKGLLRINDIAKYSARETHFLTWGQQKIGSEAVFVQYTPQLGSCIPLIYFKLLEEPDPKSIAEAHKLAWNLGQAPLLMIVLPGEIRAYSAYVNPRIKKGTNKLDETAGLIEKIEFAQKWRVELAKFKREELLSGKFWELHKARFNPRTRVERTLLENLTEIRKLLLKNNKLSSPLVHRLLGRSIFIQYLQDRQDTNKKNVFPENYFEKYVPGATCFSDVLGDKKATYNLFKDLEEKFNGDLFPVLNNEERTVSDEDLKLLSDFLTGKAELRTRQLTLWPYYSFNAIPIEFISNLYESFFHLESDKNAMANENSRKNRAGTYYTPHKLVEFLLDEVLPWDGTNEEISILDPSCGSGIFLVESYRRLVARWRQRNQNAKPTAEDLKKILTKNLYGVDSNPEAIKVAAFSLYLTMCDYLEPRYIWNQVKFPKLNETNLLASDFFDFIKNVPFKQKKFDIIIGNPPWESKVSDSASKYLCSHSRTIGDDQIAQAFLWGAAELSDKNGEIVLLAPSKGLLFNASEPNKEFRKELFSSFEVKAIINFSALRRLLFPTAAGPASAIFYKPIPPNNEKKILYCCPKSSNSPEDSWRFIIESQDISYIPLKVAKENQYIWKAAMWGTPRDWELIQKLEKLPKLRDICDSRDWIHSEGFIVGNKKIQATWLTKKPYVTADVLTPFVVDESGLTKLEIDRFERPRTNKAKIYKGPHLLISQTPKKEKGFIAAMLRDEAVFTDSILGISAQAGEDADILGTICILVNSFVWTYYAMLTSRKWLIERDELQKDEFMSLPIPVSVFEGKIKTSYSDLKKFADSNNINILWDKIISLYGLTKDEVFLMKDALQYNLSYFYEKDRANLNQISSMSLLEYGHSFCNTLNNSFSKKNAFAINIISGDMPMILAHVILDKHKPTNQVTFENAPDKLIQSLRQLDKILLEKESSSVYIRRNVRIYHGNNIYLLKRNQDRFWSRSAAQRDADEVYAEIMTSWRDNF
ncbi:MAG: N-6 DNA methylase [Deltaproteobacteria bacterium]|nr:N-6 DNA methylase [Deltaproteobacteria bacterium]